MTTLRDQFERALRARGSRLVKITPRYVVYECTMERGQYYYVGRRGSLRHGATIATSHLVAEPMRRHLLQALAWAGQK